jgi:hypothetical protein
VKRVILESPYRGDVDRNVAYAQEAALDCLRRGVPEERALGIAAGLAWSPLCDYAVFYEDLGWSDGMWAALSRYVREGIWYEKRSLEAWR